MTEYLARDYPRLAELARKRRADLGIGLTDTAAKAAGMSKGTWQRVEKGMPIRETNYIKIDRVLQWAPGSCLRMLEGAEPIPVQDIESAPGTQKSTIPPEAVEGEARDVVQLALIATAKGTTAEEIRAMSERVVQDLRDRGLI